VLRELVQKFDGGLILWRELGEKMWEWERSTKNGACNLRRKKEKFLW